MLLEDLMDLTRRTPFTFQELEKSALQLKAVNIGTSQIIDDLTMLGNIAAGSKLSLSQLADIFAQIRAGGVVFGMQMRRFRLGAIPVISDLADMLNITEEAAGKMFKSQKVTFDQMRELFRFMSSDGGRFANLMAKQSKTLIGAFSIIRDIVFLLRNEIGEQGLLKDVKSLQKSFILFLETNKQLIVLKLGKFFNSIAESLLIIARRFRIIITALIRMTNLFGGVDSVARNLLNTFAVLIALQVVAWIGRLGIAFVSLATSILVARNSMMLFNLLAGAGVIGLLLLLDDLRAFFEGEGSITGLIVEAFEEKFPNAFSVTKKAIEGVREAFSEIRSFFSEDFFVKGFIARAKVLLGVLTLNPQLIEQGLTELGEAHPKSGGLVKAGKFVEEKFGSGIEKLFGGDPNRPGGRTFARGLTLDTFLGMMTGRVQPIGFPSGAFPMRAIPSHGGLQEFTPRGTVRDISINAPATITITGVSDPQAAAIAAKEQFDNNLGEVIIQAKESVTSGER